MDWIEEHLGPAQENLSTALGSRDAGCLDRSIWHLDRVLSTQPSYIDTQLNDAARALRLPQLVQALRLLCDGLGGAALDSAQVRSFEAGVAALAELNQNLAHLVIDHNRWQRADLELRKIETNLEKHPKELEYSWPTLSRKLVSLCGAAEPWASDLDADRERLTQALAVQDAERDPAQIGDLFWSCRRQAGLRFSQVDLALKEQCDELRKIAAPLADVLMMLK